MISIEPSEIANWAGRPEASHQLPTLVRQLILAAVPPASRLEMPDGSSVQLPGWDGILTAPQGNAWVPAGTSVWEFSAQRNPAQKATEDYAKRSHDPLGIDASNATFVFVTPRRWRNKQKWTAERRNAHRWADVRVLDASDLAAWLEQAPAVAGRFARLIGKLPAVGYIPLDEWWEQWALATQPKIAPDLVVAGRTEAVNALAKWLIESPRPYYLQAHTKEESIAFLAASGLSDGTVWAEVLMAKALVVDSLDAWRSLERHQQPLTLIRNFDGDVAPQIAARQGHHVLTPLHEAEHPKGNGTSLPKPGRDETVQSLIRMGLAEQRARRLARRTARRLPIIRRLLIEDAGGPTPEWASSADYLWLPGLALIGQWDENNPDDKGLIAEVIGQPYEGIESNIAYLRQTPGSPLTRVGSLIRFTCHEEAWHLLAPRLTSSQISRFADAAVETLGQKSPQFDMAIDERHLANVYGRTLPHSGILREGIARSLALIGTHPELAQNARDSTYLPERAVTGTLNGAGWQIWATLSPLLPILAEAAPEAFLSAVEIGLEASPNPFADLFAQEASNFLFGGTPHTGLLWALERLAWSPEYFTRTAACLAQLADTDPGGQVSNRPMDSLAALFYPSIRFSEAKDDLRLATLKTLMKSYPKPAWRLLAKVHPKIHGGVVSDRQTPDWRPWGADGVQRPIDREFQQFVTSIEQLLLEYVGQQAERWVDLLDLLPSLSYESRQLASTKLSQEIDVLRAHPIANDLWDKLRRVLHHHRSHPDAIWALSPAELQLIAAAYHALTPTDPVIAYAWLFSGWPALPEGIQDHAHSDAHRNRTAELQRDAILQVLEAGGVDAVVSIAETADLPGLIGRALVMLNESAVAFDLALRHAGSESEKLRSLAFGIVATTHDRYGWAATEETVRRFKDANASVTAVADIYVATTNGQPTWDRLAGESTAVQDAYWKVIHSFRVKPDTPEQAAYTIRKLVAANRSYAAATALFCKEVPAAVIVEVLAALPHDLNTTVPSIMEAQSLHFNVLELFAILDQAEGVDDSVIATLEIPLLGVIGSQREHLALHRQVCRQPELFADLIALTFKRADGRTEPGRDDSVARHRAELAFDILFNLHECPGQEGNGAIDRETLAVWISEAQRLCKERDRENIGNQYIGAVLANAPAGADGIWPSEPVRDLLEQFKYRHIRKGMVIAVQNLRGVTRRGLLDGGTQERSLAVKYRSDAESIMAQWPYTAQILRDIASSYERQATWYDQQSAQIDEFEH